MRKTLIRSMALAGIIMISAISIAQTSRTVSGNVTDTGGYPLPGVNVIIEGTVTGTVTNIDGNYSLTVENPQTANLVFSFIGFNDQTVLVGNQSTINVVLTEAFIGLDEVVAIGYGVMRRSDLTGSIGSVEGGTLQGRGTTSAVAALQGVVPGVNITSNSARAGGGFNIQIRGQNSFEAGEPLYVVDGVVTDNINFLNPSDIERIDILKDASSTAIYGSRASNGVVIVQTKNAGEVRQGQTIISYDGYYGVRQIARMPDWMDGREFVDWRTSRYYQYNATQGFFMPDNDRNIILQNSDFLRQRLLNRDYTDWPSLVTQNGKQQNHYLTLAGNASDISYVIGVGYQNEEGNFLREYLDKYNIKMSASHKASRFFSAGGSLSLTLTENSQGSEWGYRDGFRQNPLTPAYDADGNLVPQPGSAAGIQGTGGFTSSPNPLAEIDNGTREDRRYDVLGNIFVSITPVDGLEFKTTLAPRFTRLRTGAYYGAILGGRSNSLAFQENKEWFDYTWDNVLNYRHSIGAHTINTTLINSVYATRYESSNVGAERLPYDSQWYNIGSGTLLPGRSGSAYSETSLLSYAARINYSYMGKYLATATIRYDGSSKLADKWDAFPSFALAWRMSEENFMTGASWLSNLKLRLSYGYTGNNYGVNPFGTQLTPKYGSLVYYDYNGNVVSGFAPGDPVNVALSWEKTREYNIGLDYGFLNNRINGTIDWYDKLSDGLLMPRLLAIESGVVSMIDNIGSVSNKGIEIGLNTVNVNTRDLQWTTNFTYSRNKNAIVSLYGEKKDVVGERRFIGQPINVIYDYVFDGVWTPDAIAALPSARVTGYQAVEGRAIARDLNDDGFITADEDMAVLGSPDPKWIGSFSSTLNYKNFDFSFNIFTHQGVLVDSPFLREFGFVGDRGRSKINMDYYIPAGLPRFDENLNWITTTGHYSQKYPAPGLAGPYYGSNAYYTDASFVKVKNITLGYTLPKDLIDRAKIASMRVYMNILNPFVWTDHEGYDPEYAHVSLENGNGPANVTYQFGVNVKF